MWLQATTTLDSVDVDQHCAAEVTAMTETAEKWLLSTWNVASSVTEEVKFSLSSTVIHFNLKSHMGLVAAALKSTVLDQRFLNLNVLLVTRGSCLNSIFWFSVFGEKPEILHFKHALRWRLCCWSTDHTLRSRALKLCFQFWGPSARSIHGMSDRNPWAVQELSWTLQKA